MVAPPPLEEDDDPMRDSDFGATDAARAMTPPPVPYAGHPPAYHAWLARVAAQSHCKGARHRDAQSSREDVKVRVAARL